MGALTLQPSFESEGLRFRGIVADNGRAYVAGEPRSFGVEVENLGAAPRRGKLIFVFRSELIHAIRIVPVSLQPSEKKVVPLERFSPPSEGVYNLRLAIGGPSVGVREPWLEFFGGRDDTFLTPWAGDIPFLQIAAFRVFDSFTYSEVRRRETTERTRWLVLVLLTAASATAAWILLASIYGARL